MPELTIQGLGAVGVIADPYDLDAPAQGWSFARNARFGEKGAQAVRGDLQVLVEEGQATPITPLWIKCFPPFLDPRWLIADNNQVYIYQDFEYTNITRYTSVPGDNNYGATDRWQGTIFNGVGILNNGFDPPQQWAAFDSAEILEDLANWPANYRCRFIKPFGNFLIAGYIFDGADTFPFRILWSHPASPGSVPANWNFADPASDSRFIDLARTGDAVVDGLDLGNQFIVYREGTTHALQLTGTRSIFGQRQISGQAGILWKDCVAELPNGHLVATWDDLVFHQGTPASFRSVLEGRVRKTLASRRDPDNYKNSFLVRNEPDKEVWFCFPEVGHTYANIALIWNRATGQVGFRDLNSVPFADAGPVLLEA